MRTLRKALGWIVTIGFFALAVTVLLAKEALPDILANQIPDLPDWVAWLIVGALGAGSLWVFVFVLLSPKQRRAWRQQRAEARERRRKLENFEIE